MDQPIEKCAGCENHRACTDNFSVREFDARYMALFFRENDLVCHAFNDDQIFLVQQKRLDGLFIEGSVSLRPRTADGRSFAPVQNAELYSCCVCCPCHESVKSINFPNEVTFSKSTNSRVARHSPYRGKIECNQGRSGAKTRSGSGCFRASMAAAHNDNIERIRLSCCLIFRFHVKHLLCPALFTDAKSSKQPI